MAIQNVIYIVKHIRSMCLSASPLLPPTLSACMCLLIQGNAPTKPPSGEYLHPEMPGGNQVLDPALSTDNQQSIFFLFHIFISITAY